MPTVSSSEELYLDQTTTFAADLTYEFTAPLNGRTVAISIGDPGLIGITPSFFNYGTLSAYDPGSQSSGATFLISVGHGFWRESVFENHGLMRAISAAGDAFAIGSSSWCPSIVNTGSISVQATEGEAIAIRSFAANLDWLPFSVTNSGTISSVGDHAWALYVLHSEIQNDGVLSATGGTRGAFTIVTAQSTITNSQSGSIVADSSLPGGHATAIAFSSLGMNSLKDNEVFNAGLILGGVAIAEMVDSGSQTRITNTGEIRGTIDLISGNDVLRNSGLINGNVFLGAGEDLYDGREGGRVVGLVDGGSGLDVVLLSGDRQSFTFSASAGITTVRSNTSGEVLQFKGVERFRFDDGLYDLAGNALAEPVIEGTLGADILAGTGDSDTIVGLAGDDVIDAGVGDDTIDGGEGQDVAVFSGRSVDYELSFSDAQIVVVGRDGTDTLTNVEGLSFEDLLIVRGTSSGDFLYGSRGKDIMYGREGNDTLDGGSGDDLLYGGAGDDLYYIDTQADLVFEAAGEGTDTIVVSGNFYLYENVENLTLSGGAHLFGVGNTLDNVITGNSGRNLLLGGKGSDVLFGVGGNDSLFGEVGHDYLSGGAGIDYLVGGLGDDVLLGDADADALYGGDGDDVLWGGSTFDTDILVGGAGNDILRGDSGLADYDLLDGDAGDDLYWVDTGDDLTFEAVGGGNDTVYADVRVANAGVYLYANVENLVLVGTTAFGVGNELNNLMIGSNSANYLLGGAGDDVLDGRGGNDVLFGEAGNDVFVFQPGSGGDVIGDFTIGQDRIDLKAFGFANFDQLKVNFSQVGADGAINLGNGDFIVLHGVTMANLTAAQFIFPGQASPADALAGILPANDARFAQPVSAPAETDADTKADADSGPQVLPVADDLGLDGKVAGPQVLPGLDDDAFVVLSKDAAGPQVLPVADTGPATKDAGPQVLPGLGEDDFIVGKTALDTGPQVLPGAEDDLFGLDALPDGLALRMAIWSARGDDFLSDTLGDLPLALQPENEWGWA